MPRQRWTEIKPLLDRALDLPPEERLGFARAHCGGDEELQRELESYLELGSDVEDLFEEPILDIIAGRPPEYRTGQQIGPYRLEGEIDRGGMGVVYKGRRVAGGFQQEVAIKVLRKGFDSGDFVRRFRIEQQILADLDHTHIVRLLDGGATEDGLPYLVMEAVEGRRLDRYCQEEELDLDERLDLFLKICDAVHAAHQHMVVHCDLKPSNILVTADGDPKLLDFGIAKVLQQGPDGVDASLTLRLGTPPYASPEQVGGASATTANDVYSLGALLYLLLTGRKPKSPKGPEAPVQLPSKAPPPTLRREELRGDLDAITLKAMAWDPEVRYASAAALAEDLRRHRARLPVAAQPYTWPYVARLFFRRRKKEVLLVAGVILVLLATTAFAAYAQVRAQFEASRAEGTVDAYLEVLEIYDPTSGEPKAEAVRTAIQELSAIERLISDQDRAKIYDRLGRQLYRLGYPDEGKLLLQRSFALRRQAARTHPEELAAALNNVALFLRGAGDTDGAVEYYEEALALHAENPGLDVYEYSDIRANLAMAYLALGDFEEAETQFLESLDLRSHLFGEDSLAYALSLNNFGLLLVQQRRFSEAEEVVRKALTLRRKHLDPGHPDIAVTLIGLGSLADAQGNQEAAIAAYREALEIRRQALGAKNLKTARAQAALGYSLSGRAEPEDLAEARGLLERAHAILVATRGQDHGNTLIVQRHLAAVLLQQGDAEAAEALIRPVVDRSEIWESRFPWRAADARSLLGACLLARGETEKAQPLLEGAAEIIAREKGEDSRYTREARERWAALKTAAELSPGASASGILQRSDDSQ